MKISKNTPEWGEDGAGSPAYVYSFEKGRELIGHQYWFENGIAKMPNTVRYGVGAGAVRATFLSEEAAQLEATVTVWVFPDQMVESLECDESSEDERRRACLTTVLTTVVHRLNQSAHLGTCSSFAHLLNLSKRLHIDELRSTATRGPLCTS